MTQLYGGPLPCEECGGKSLHYANCPQAGTGVYAMDSYRVGRPSESQVASVLETEKFRNAVLFSALFELVEAIDANSGYEPSKSVYDRALDEARAVLAGKGPTL